MSIDATYSGPLTMYYSLVDLESTIAALRSNNWVVKLWKKVLDSHGKHVDCILILDIFQKFEPTIYVAPIVHVSIVEEGFV